MNKKMVKVCCGLGIVGSLTAAGIGSAAQISGTVTVHNGSSTIVNDPSKKETSGSAAQVTLKTGVAVNDTVSVYAINAKGNRVTDAVKFNNTSKNVLKKASYVSSGYAVKGAKYRPKFTLLNGSRSTKVSLNYEFAS